VSVYRLDRRLVFPHASEADASGLIAVGGDLRPERLILAYASGIFPWYSKGQPILWHSPDPRLVLRPNALHVPRSLRKVARKAPYRLSLDTAFCKVIEACAGTPRPGQEETWITREMKDAYTELHRRGVAHSVEAWRGQRLVGGLYGISLGAAFFGESMFALEPDASKLAFVALCEQFALWGVKVVDCQVYTPHLARFGAEEWSRRRYLSELHKALRAPTRPGPWSFDTPT
jgi:leucyl/phenylalanyl-tRNA--protein transferase